MPVGSRERAGIFHPLPPEGFVRLVEDATLRRAYLDALTYMHDLAAPYWDDPVPSRFDAEHARIQLGLLVQNYFESDDLLSEHIEENAESARDLSHRGPTVVAEGSRAAREELRREASVFVRGILSTYNRVRPI